MSAKFSFKVAPATAKVYEFKLNSAMALELVIALATFVDEFDAAPEIVALLAAVRDEYDGDLPNEGEPAAA